MRKSLKIILLAIIFAGSWLFAAHGEARSITVRGQVLADAHGRQVLLRGVNAGGRSKLPPFLPFDPGADFDSALEKYADNVKAMGFNVVRLLVIYEAAEPIRGEYDRDYLEKYDAMVDAFARRDIYIIVDGHQDLYSRRFHGDGFPDWAIPEAYRENEQTHDRKIWNRGYFMRPVLTSFQRFWDNYDGIQDQNVEFYRMLAERYKGREKVIGFEPINEPMPGWKGYLNYEGFHKAMYEYYRKVGEATQSVDPSYLLFADICAIENTGTLSTIRKKPPVDNLVLAPHYYDLGTFGKAISKGGDKWIMEIGVGRHMKLARNWGVPALFTEYGISPKYNSAPQYIDELYSIFDDHLASGTFWEASMSEQQWNFENTSIFEPDGTMRERAAALDRPYPMAVNYEIVSFHYDSKTGASELVWQEDPTNDSPTLIYLPARIYGDSPKISCPDGAWRMEPGKNILVIDPAADGKERREIRIEP